MEINLGAYLKKLCLQWKLAVILGLVMGLILMMYKHSSDLSAAQSQPDTTKGNLVSSLSDVEKMEVDFEMDVEKQLDNIMKYRDESLMMQIDPYNAHEVTVIFALSAANKDEVQKAKRLYMEYYSSMEFAEALKSALGEEAEAKYVQELLTSDDTLYVNDSSTSQIVKLPAAMSENGENETVLVVNMALTDSMDGATAISTITDLITGYKSAVSGATVTKLAEKDEVLIDENMAIHHQGITGRANGLESAVKTNMRTEFSDNQKALVNLLRQEGVTEVADLDASAEAAPAEEVSVGYSTKSFGLGIILGIIMYAVLLLLYYMFRPQIGRTFGVNSALNIKNVADIYVGKKPGLLRFLSEDPILYKAFYPASKDKDAQIREAGLNIDFLSGTEDVQGFTLVSAGEVLEYHKDVILGASHAAKGCSVNELPIADTAALYENLKGLSDHVIMVIESDRTKVKDIQKLWELLSENGTEVSGLLQIN